MGILICTANLKNLVHLDMTYDMARYKGKWLVNGVLLLQ